MARVICAVGEPAGEPYYVEKVERNVWSAEELSWLLVQSARFLDAGIMDPVMVDWLETQCALPELAEKLRPLLGKERELSAFVSSILNYTGFVTPDKEEKTREIVSSGQGMEEFGRRMTKAAYLSENLQPYAALEEYEAILRELPELERETRIRALCAAGRIYAEMFMFRTAAERYEKAWQLSGDRETYLKFLSAKRLELSDSEYVAFISEHPEAGEASLELEKRLDRYELRYESSEMRHTIDRIREYRSNGQEGAYEMALHEAISQIREDYLKTKAPAV